MPNMLKICLPTAIFAIILIATATTAYANADIHVTINGERVTFDGQAPVVVNDRVLVPARGVFQQLGFDVAWDPYARQVTLTGTDATIVLTVGSRFFRTNGVTHTLSVPVQIINDTTMLPIRPVLESAGFHVGWDETSRTVLIYSQATTRTVVRYYQRDPRWRNVPFGSFTVGSGGCGPVAIAMVVSTLRGVEVLPCYVATWGRRFYVDGIGSAHAMFTHRDMHNHFGLNFRSIHISNEAEILDALRNGAMIITSVQSRNSPSARPQTQGLFTIIPNGIGGHFAVLHGVTPQGNILVETPIRADVGENADGWPLNQIINEMHRNVNELWVFTVNENAVVSFGRCHEN